MPVVRDPGSPPAASSLYAYSTDLTSSAGRLLDAPAGTNTSAAFVASWTYQMPANSVLKGNGSLTLYAATPSGLTTSRPQFAVYLDKVDMNGNLVSTLDTATYLAPTAGWGCTGFAPFSVALDGIPNNVSISANQRLRVRVMVTNSVPMLLAYGTGTFPSQLALPFSSGVG
jgi:hypothetical protein